MNHSINANTCVNNIWVCCPLDRIFTSGMDFQIRKWFMNSFLSNTIFFFSRDISLFLCFYIPAGIRALHQEKSPKLF